MTGVTFLSLSVLTTSVNFQSTDKKLLQALGRFSLNSQVKSPVFKVSIELPAKHTLRLPSIPQKTGDDWATSRKFVPEYSLTFRNESLECEQIDVLTNGALMKKTQKLINWLVIGGFALAMVTSVAAQTTKERTGKVVRIKGDARYSTGDSVWHEVKVGTKLKSGALIQTAQSSYVDIILDEAGEVPSFPSQANASIGDTLTYQPEVTQDVIRVWEDTVLVFDKLTVINTGVDEVMDTQLDLRAGRIMGMVKKMSTLSRYEIKLPNGVAGVRGTIFSISAAGVVKVVSGAVVISWTGPDGAAMTQVVNAGYQFDISTGLLSKIPVPEERNLRGTGLELCYEYKTTPGRVVVVDKTIYFVSPK